MHDHNSKSLRLETDRLLIRPIESAEIGDFHAIASRREIAENLASIPHPMSEETAKEWLAERAFRGIPDFVAGIFNPDEVLIGCIGISDNPVTTYYFFASEHWGHGYASEVLNPFLDWCAKQFGIKEFKVGVHGENIGSRKVLEKSGFLQTHVTLFQPPFRESPDLLYMYWKGYGAPAPLATGTGLLYIHPIHPGHAYRLVELESESEDFQLLGVTDPPFTAEHTPGWIDQSFNQPNLHRLAITNTEGLMTGAGELSVEENAGNIKIWISSNQRDEAYVKDALKGLVSLAFDRVPDMNYIVSYATDKAGINDLIRSVGFTDLPASLVPVARGDVEPGSNCVYLTREAFCK